MMSLQAMTADQQDAYEKALAAIHVCLAEQGTYLDLSGLGLTLLPAEIGQLTALTRLDLNNNQLSTMPTEISQLTALTALDLSDNQLSTMPTEIGKLTALISLNFGGNMLNALPTEIGQLTALTTLNLMSNQLSTLPTEIGQLTTLNHLILMSNRLSTLPTEIGQLIALTHLDLMNNQLSTLPTEVGQLTVLTFLDLRDNQLSSLPTEIGQLTVLTKLYLSNNQFSVPATEIGQLSALTHLDLMNNQLSTLPAEICQLSALTDLTLSNNQLSTLPAEISQLSALTCLDLRGNLLGTLPAEIGQLSTLTELDLRGNHLKMLPIEIGQLTALTQLFLSSNRLSTLPVEISRLTALTHLYLSNNRFSTLPIEIGQLTALTSLDLRNNQLRTLPTEIGQLTALISLNLRNNQLCTLPAEIGQLTALTRLNLGDNQLSTIPTEIGQLTALTYLDLSDNQLSALPLEIGQLTALTSLYLGNNQLSTIPTEIGQLIALTRFDLSDNQLSTLPTEIGQLTALTDLDLRGNQLSTLPLEIGQLPTLIELYLHDNSTLGIPESILGKQPSDADIPRELREKDNSNTRPQDILNFYFSLRQGAEQGSLRAVNEVKVMLVGRGGAGKTSLRRFFMGQPHDTNESETPGIALDSFRLPCEQGEKTVRLWDFAGQEITHALHQFFLTEGCVYILVLDPRSDTEMRDAEYWLEILKRYADSAPVLVVLNRQDARQGGYNVDRLMLQERFPSIRSFTPTNCERREGCDELLLSLRETIQALKPTEPPHLQVPDTWLKVMKACQGEARKQQHMTLDEFRDICSTLGETEAEKQESLARLLHKLGAVLHFIDEPRLRDTAVLNPHWLTDGVYRLLRFKDRPESDGTLTLAESLLALPNECEETARFFLRLMERFEMCIPLDDEGENTQTNKWLIPGALGEFQPKTVNSADWQKPGGVRLRYVYEPLPEGVLPRFIVMTHSLSEDTPRWRNGVILQDGPAAAWVRRGQNRNHVEITAFGPEAERLRLLEIIQGNFERIHADLPDPKPVKELELAVLPGTFRAEEDLAAAEATQQKVAVGGKDQPITVEPTPQLNQTSEQQVRTSDRIRLKIFLSYSHFDTKTKSVFTNNLTVMQQKKYITFWGDGRIETDRRWKEEITENLERMDVFVGLLTTAFLASGFIETVDLKAARTRLAEKKRDFIFVLILVEDISLQGLDLSEYHIIRPGGKSVDKHSSRKAGFNEAQKDLEKLVIARQNQIKQLREDEPAYKHQRNDAFQHEEGFKIIVQGDYNHYSGGKSMVHDQSIRIGGNVTHSQVGQALQNCTLTIQQQAPGELKTLLETLQVQVQKIIASLPEEKQEHATEVMDDLEMVVKQATADKPNLKWYSVSKDGLLEAATWVKDITPNVVETLSGISTILGLK